MARTQVSSTDWYKCDTVPGGGDIYHSMQLTLCAGDVANSTGPSWVGRAYMSYNFANAGALVKQELATFSISGWRTTGTDDVWEVVLYNTTDGAALVTLTPSNTSLGITSAVFSLPTAEKTIEVRVRRASGSGGTYTIRNAWIEWYVSP